MTRCADCRHCKPDLKEHQFHNRLYRVRSWLTDSGAEARVV